MFCPQCGAQTEQSTKFCKSCGLKLADHARLLEEPREVERMSEAQWRRERRLMIGVVMMIVTVFDLILFFVIFGSILLAQPHNNQPGYLIMLASFLAVALICTGTGVWNLVGSGFFRNMRERQLRIELALLEQKRKAIESETQKNQTSLPHPKRDAEGLSVAENTTRELQPVAVTNRKISGE